MREIVHLQAGQCGNQIGAKVRFYSMLYLSACLSCLSNPGSSDLKMYVSREWTSVDGIA